MSEIKFSHDTGRFSSYGCNFLKRDTSNWVHGGNIPIHCTAVLADVVTAQLPSTAQYFNAPEVGSGSLFYNVSGNLNRAHNVDVIITGNFDLVGGTEVIETDPFTVTITAGNTSFLIPVEVKDNASQANDPELVQLNLKSGQACIDTDNDVIPDNDEFIMTVFVRKHATQT